MAMISETFNHLLQKLPVETHPKAEQIYGRIPGTLMKFLNTSNSVQKKVECSNNIIINGKLNVLNKTRCFHDLVPDNTDCRDMVEYGETCERSARSYDSRTVSNKYVNSRKRQISSEACSMPMEYDHHNWDRFRAYLLDSLRNEFQKKSITEISPDEIGNRIFDQYQEQCLKLGQHRKTSSLPIRFEKHYSIMNGSGQIYIGVCYVDAYIVCQSEKTWSQKYKTNMNYLVSLELNGFSQDYEKIKQFEEMISKNDVPTVIQTLEAKSQLTWDGFLKK